MKIHCLADEHTVRGFRLAGLAGQVVSSAPEAAGALAALTAQPDCGIVILTQSVADRLRPQVDRIRLERTRPLIVEIPGPEGPLAGRRGLRQFIQAAVGMRIGANKGSE